MKRGANAITPHVSISKCRKLEGELYRHLNLPGITYALPQKPAITGLGNICASHRSP
jgi:hypothetical protein